MTLAIFIIVLSILVLVHECGHFVAAKLFGVKAEEFGIGIPPRLFGKKIGQTLYSVNLLPFGGFVKLLGEDEMEGGSDGKNKDPQSFMSKTPFQRILIIVAGVTMNLILAVTLYYAVLVSHGFQSLNIPLFYDYTFRFGEVLTTSTVISGFSEDAPLQAAGGEFGEAVIGINGIPTNTVEELHQALVDKAEQEVEVLLLDKRQNSSTAIRSLKVAPAVGDEGQGILGVYLADVAVLDYSDGMNKFLAGPMHAYNMFSYSTNVLGKLISTSVKTRDAEPLATSVAGPVGVYSIVGSILEYGGEGRLLTLLDFMALMSLSLAFINILPLPALDGGRLFFVGIELVARKKINPIFEAYAHRIGLVVLIGLLVLVSIKDVLFL